MPSPCISASILAADAARLGEECQNILTAGADWIHFDVMDNHYVPNLTLGPFVCEHLRRFGIEAPIDVHLMTRPVDPLIESFAKAGASSICFHPEASDHVHRSLSLIRQHGCQAGLAFNPATPLQWLDSLADMLDFVLLMSVNPGFGGQTFLPSSIEKITKVRQWANQHNPSLRVSVDGGVNEKTLGGIVRAGADTFVMGSALFSQQDYPQAIASMQKIIGETQ